MKGKISSSRDVTKRTGSCENLTDDVKLQQTV
jgi:hypothetical protein